MNIQERSQLRAELAAMTRKAVLHQAIEIGGAAAKRNQTAFIRFCVRLAERVSKQFPGDTLRVGGFSLSSATWGHHALRESSRIFPLWAGFLIVSNEKIKRAFAVVHCHSSTCYTLIEQLTGEPCGGPRTIEVAPKSRTDCAFNRIAATPFSL